MCFINPVLGSRTLSSQSIPKKSIHKKEEEKKHEGKTLGEKHWGKNGEDKWGKKETNKPCLAIKNVRTCRLNYLVLIKNKLQTQFHITTTQQETHLYLFFINYTINSGYLHVIVYIIIIQRDTLSLSQLYITPQQGAITDISLTKLIIHRHLMQ